MYDWETYQKAYMDTSKEIRDILDSELIPTCVTGVISQNQLDASHFSKLSRIYCLLITNAITEFEADEEMLRIGIPDRKRVISLLHQCVGTTQELSISTKTKNITGRNNNPSIHPLADEIDNSHIQKETLYSTSQESLLRKDNNDGSSRWGSEK